MLYAVTGLCLVEGTSVPPRMYFLLLGGAIGIGHNILSLAEPAVDAAAGPYRAAHK